MPHFNKSVGVRASDIYTLWTKRKAAMGSILRQIVDDLGARRISPAIGEAFPIDRVEDAHALLSSGNARGKLVVTHPDYAG
jgi:NADPH2:quinone reductase